MSHAAYMNRCFHLAQRGEGFTAPNPLVGAVLVYENQVIGEGWHTAYGEHHAEVECFNAVAEIDKHLIPAATLYVNLEPCSHYGKTPPCAARIIQEGIKRVVVAMEDPNPLVAGKGIAMLKEAGIDVITGIETASAVQLNKRFLCAILEQKPYIVLKWAQTPNGFFAPNPIAKMQLSSGETAVLVHQWRTQEAAIMVGTQTALVDNPQLNARLWHGKQPTRVVVDRLKRIPASFNVMDNSQPTLIFNALDHDTIENTEWIKINFDDNIPLQITEALHQKKLNSVLIEGGKTLLEAFIDQNLWHEARVITAPAMLHYGLAAPLLKNAIPLASRQVGKDTINTYIHYENQYY